MKSAKTKNMSKFSLKAIISLVLVFAASCGPGDEDIRSPISWLSVTTHRSNLMISNEKADYDYALYVNPTAKEREKFVKQSQDCGEFTCLPDWYIDPSGKKRYFTGNLSKEWIDRLKTLFTPEKVQYYKVHSEKSTKICSDPDKTLSLLLDNIGEDRKNFGVTFWCHPDEVTDEKVKTLLDTLNELETEMLKKHSVDKSG